MSVLRWTRRSRAFDLFVGFGLVGFTGCFNPEDSSVVETDGGAASSSTSAAADATDGAETGGTSGEESTGSGTTAAVTAGETTTSAATTDASTTTDDGDTSTGGSDDDSSSGDESSSGEPVAPACDDGIVVATEVCFEVSLEMTDEFFRFGRLEDLDGDGDRDLIFSAASGEVEVRLNSDAVFGLATTSTFNGVSSISDFGALHIDDDGVLDAFLVSISGAATYTAFGATSGDFVLGDGHSSEAFALAMGDLGGTDRLEAVVISLNGVEVFGIEDDGTISVLDTVAPNNANIEDAVQLADFNGDEQLDVLYLGQSFTDGPLLELLLGNGDGTIASSPLGDFVTFDAPSDMIVGDFDADEAADIAIIDGEEIIPVFGNDALTFTQMASITVDSGTPTSMATDDIDLDGLDDLLIGYSDRNVVTVYLGQSDQTFASPVDVSIPHPAQRISTGDANGDEVPDIVVTSFSSQALTVVFSTN